MTLTTLGIDLAKSVFQLHGVDETGQVIIRKKLRRSAVLNTLRKLEPCLVGMEACATAHYWSREISALGHEVKLMPPAYVKPYVKRGKNDMADAEAICEAVTRPTMRFVPVKSAERQGVLVLHRTRDLLMRQRTMLLNAVRGHLAEFGLIAPQGPRKVMEMIARMREGAHAVLPEIARTALLGIGGQLDALARQIHALERQLLTWHRQDAASQRLETVPGVGIITATALEASVPDPSVFRSGRQFAAFAPAELLRRKRPARAHLENGRWLPATAARGWCHVCHPPRRNQPIRDRGMGTISADAQAGAGDYRCYGEQDRKGRMGRAGARRDLSSTGDGVTEHEPQAIRVVHSKL